MMKKTAAAGFTLIELVIVIAIIGILAAIAIPKYVNLAGSAQQNATAAIAGALASGSAINYAARSLTASTATVAVTNCTDVATTLAGGLPSGYTIVSAAVTSGNSVTCTLNGPSGPSSTFTATGIT